MSLLCACDDVMVKNILLRAIWRRTQWQIKASPFTQESQCEEKSQSRRFQRQNVQKEIKEGGKKSNITDMFFVGDTDSSVQSTRGKSLVLGLEFGTQEAQKLNFA